MPGILDYIWHTAERLRVMRILEQIDHDTLTAYTALPSPQVLALLALLRTHTNTHTAYTALPSPQVLTLLALLRARTHTLCLPLSLPTRRSQAHR